MALRAVLFDAAGTLIELVEAVGDTYARTASRHGVDLPAWRLDDAFRRVVARAEPMAFPGAAPGEIRTRERAWWSEVVRSTFLAADSTLRFADFGAFFDDLFEAFRAPAWRARPGALAALGALRGQGLATGVVSNFDQRLYEILEVLDFTNLLDVVTLPSDCGRAKPDAAIFALALERLGVPAASALYVGDDPRDDSAGAAAAGLRFLDVREFDSLQALPARIDALATLSGSTSDAGPGEHRS